MSESYRIGIAHPRDPRAPHVPQQKVLEEFAKWEYNHKRGAGIQYLNYVGGRGSGKTTIALLLLFMIASTYGDKHTFWSARTGDEIDRVLVGELEKQIPADLYELKYTRKGAYYIQWFSGHVTWLISRSVDNPKKRPGLGSNVMGGFHDEAATEFFLRKFTDINNGIREPGAPFLFCMCTSTPLPNAFQLWCESPSATTIFSSSYDSPYLSKAALDSMAEQMDKDEVEQELHGKFCVTSGRQWDTFVEAPWPYGNIIEGAEFDPIKPWFLWADLGGAQGGYQIVQYLEPINPVTGHREFEGKIATIVAEITPNKMALPEVCDLIIDKFCGGDHIARRPEKVCVGHDVNAEDKTGPTGAEYFASLGWPFEWPKGYLIRKTTQRTALRRLICNTRGERRYAVAANKNEKGVYEIVCQLEGEGKMRGILNVMRNDTYPGDDSDEVFVKDKKKAGKHAMEDDRDCSLYGAVINHPPSFNVQTVLAKNKR